MSGFVPESGARSFLRRMMAARVVQLSYHPLITQAEGSFGHVAHEIKVAFAGDVDGWNADALLQQLRMHNSRRIDAITVRGVAQVDFW